MLRGSGGRRGRRWRVRMAEAEVPGEGMPCRSGGSPATFPGRCARPLAPRLGGERPVAGPARTVPIRRRTPGVGWCYGPLVALPSWPAICSGQAGLRGVPGSWQGRGSHRRTGSAAPARRRCRALTARSPCCASPGLPVAALALPPAAYDAPVARDGSRAARPSDAAQAGPAVPRTLWLTAESAAAPGG
jgi:hypothetical protein